MSSFDLLQQFGVVASAPNGVQRLREMVLQLAVQGKLVPQDPTDEPASRLLERIAAEKERLIAEGKIKRQKPLPVITEEEKPFELPQGWEWVRLGELVNVLNGRAYKKEELLPKGKIPVLRVGNLFTSNHWYYSDLDLEVEKYCDNGDLLYAWSASFGPFIWQGDKVIYHYHIWKLDFYYEKLNKNYLYTFLLEKTQELKSLGHGVSMIHMTKDTMEKLVVPIPPFVEQQRILAKVDSLLALCDQLEVLQSQKSTLQSSTWQEVLNAITNASSTLDLTTAWQRLEKHLALLVTEPEQVKGLRDTLLQLAVQGKLVPQDPNDEPASVLLAKIQAEKERLIKEGKIKRQKPLPPITEEEKPFELPKGWEWVRLGDLALLITSGSRDWAKYYSNKGAIFVRMGNLSRGHYKMRLDSLQYVTPPEDKEGARTRLETNDILISITGDVGMLGLVPANFGEAYINQHTCLVRFSAYCQSRYFPEFLRSPLAVTQFNAPQRGIKNSFRLSDIGEILVPLPPEGQIEQVVSKVDSLMSLCDQLESRLQTARQTQAQFALETVNHLSTQ